MNNHQNTFSYRHGGNIDEFHEFLVWHPKLKYVRNKVLSILFHGLRLAEQAHQSDIRKSTGLPYINHQIEIVLDILNRERDEKIQINKLTYDILIMVLHDVLEDHPEYWREIHDQFGLRTFRDVLVLATGGLALKLGKSFRQEMVEYFVLKYPFNLVNKEQEILTEIGHILSPIFPIDKLQRYGTIHRYRDLDDHDSQRIEKAILLYQKNLISPSMDDQNYNIQEFEEYVALGNYLFFTEHDARRKFYDMLNNMSDVKNMELKKPGYIGKRRIKAYILGVKLQNLHMLSEYDELQRAFQRVGSNMLTDQEIGWMLNKK